MHSKALLILAFILTAVCVPGYAHALDKLEFEENIKSPSLKLQIDDFLRGFYNTDSVDFDIAFRDLHADGIEEYILKRKTCVQNKVVCTHFILASQNEKIRLLSSIRAKHIIVSSTVNYGINDLLIFESDINDYDFDIYMWSPREKMYILNAENKEDE